MDNAIIEMPPSEFLTTPRTTLYVLFFVLKYLNLGNILGVYITQYIDSVSIFQMSYDFYVFFSV